MTRSRPNYSLHSATTPCAHDVIMYQYDWCPSHSCLGSLAPRLVVDDVSPAPCSAKTSSALLSFAMACLLNLRSLLRTTLGKAIDLPAYSCVETLVRALSHQDTETHSTKGFTAVPDNSTFYSSTTCIQIRSMSFQCH